jgi:hypothetical protein
MNAPRTHRKVNWIPIPNPLTEEEVNIQITWTADERTTAAIERQAKFCGFDTPTDYLLQALAAAIANTDDDTLLTDDGRFVAGCRAEGPDGLPQNV